MAFKLQQILDVGTANPIVARLSVGLFDIVEMAGIDKDKKEDLKSKLFEAMKLLIQAEKVAIPIIEEVNKNLGHMQANGIETQSNGRVVNLPSTKTLDDVRVFLKHAKQVLQKSAEIFSIMLGKEFKGPHFHKIKECLKEEFGVEDELTRLVNEDEQWIKKIIELRSEDEHPSSGKPFYSDFDVTIEDGKEPVVILPVFYDGSQIAQHIEVYTHNLLTFLEETVILFLMKHYPEIVTVNEIPEEKRDPKCPIRFRTALKDNDRTQQAS